MISPSLNGRPSARAKPIAAGVPESGIGRTRSASTGASARELLAHPHARVVHLDALEPAVGAGEVEELPDAERAAVGAVERLGRMEAVGVGDDELARLDLADELGADEVERAGLDAKTQCASSQPPDHERPEAVRVAEGDEPSLRERDDGVGAVETLHRVRHGLVERRLVVRDQRRDELAVGRRPERDAGPAARRALADVDQVAVVAERDGARAAVLDERLRVRPLRRAGRRVAVVADRDLAAQAAELLLVEDLGDEPEVAQRRQAPVLGDRDPRRLLAAMLQREEAEVREPRDVAVGCVDAEDAAHQATTLSGRSRASPDA